MKAFMARWADRIDASSLRERVLMFFAMGAVLFVLIYSPLIAPTLESQRLLARQIAQRQTETRVLQDQIQLAVRRTTEDPNAVMRKRVEALRLDLAKGEETLKVRQAELVPPEKMTALLEQIVGRDRRLQLESLKSIDPDEQPEGGNARATSTNLGAVNQPVTGALPLALAQLAPNAGGAPNSGGKPSGAPAEPPQSPPRKFFRHGVELTVKGGYLELLQFLVEIEKMPYRIFWAGLDLSAGDFPTATLKIKVFTLSLDRAWMAV